MLLGLTEGDLRTSRDTHVLYSSCLLFPGWATSTDLPRQDTHQYFCMYLQTGCGAGCWQITISYSSPSCWTLTLSSSRCRTPDLLPGTAFVWAVDLGWGMRGVLHSAGHLMSDGQASYIRELPAGHWSPSHYCTERNSIAFSRFWARDEVFQPL